MQSSLTDQKARDKIMQHLDESFFVEAGAGSGKTYCLVERMVNLIKKGKARIENIAAVTFTRKAAAELKERFQIKLEAGLRSDIANHEKEHMLRALSNLEQAFIGTIHAFCAKVLRERPVEAGVDPDFREIEESEDAVYAQRAWYDYMEKARFGKNPDLKLVLDMGYSVDDLMHTYFRLIQNSDVQLVTRKMQKPDFTEAKQAVKRVIEHLSQQIPSREPQKGWDRLQEMIKKAENYMASGYLKKDRLFLKLLHEMNKKPRVTKNRWPEANSQECLEKVLEFQKTNLGPLLGRWQNYMHKPMIDFLLEAVRHYEQWRRSHSVLNFQDLLTGTARLLRSHTEIRDYFKKRYTHILVDEFQDTDPIQAEIIMLLASVDARQDSWKNISPAPGALFVVGDPKQSIYRFRRADIDIYNLVKKVFAVQGNVLYLSSNFRSLPFMQDLVDQVFGAVFPGKETRFQAQFFPLNTCRKADQGFDGGIWENPLPKVARDSSAKAAKIDAAMLANWIKDAVDGNIRLQRTEEETKKGLDAVPRYADFLILARTKKNLSLYAQCLEMMGIPYDITGGEDFAQSFELGEIYKLFRAVDDCRDPVALVTALRGIFFGISDDMLYQFKKGGGKFSYFSKVPPGFDAFEQAYSRLREYRAISCKHSPLAAAEMLVERLGIIPLAVSKPKGLSRAGNIYKAMELLKGSFLEKLNTFSDLTQSLKELLDNSELESMSLVPWGKNAVRIMNLHKAKGLEAPVVILADPLGGPKNHVPDYHITRTETDEAQGYFSINKISRNYAAQTLATPPGWDQRQKQEQQYDEAEQRRLDYVAATRAKNILVVSTYRRGKREKAWQILYDYLEHMPKIAADHQIRQKDRDILHVSCSQWQKVKEGIEDCRRRIKAASYGLSNVTAEAKEGMVWTQTEQGGGKGTKWGKLVHKAIEMACRGGYKKISLLAEKWIQEEGLQDIGAQVLVSAVDRFMKSSLWARIRQSEKKYFEVPFAYKQDRNMMVGIIDAVFLEDGGWVIVDYKTDDFHAHQQRREAYQKQLAIYKRYWEKISGQKVKQTLLFKV